VTPPRPAAPAALEDTFPADLLPTLDHGPPPDPRLRARPTWGLAEGDELAPGRSVLRRLGGGRRYEVFLVWDEHRLALLVAKVLRPDQAGEARALDDLRREAELVGRLAHPVLVRGFDAVLDGRFPHLVVEHLEGPTLAELLERDGPLPAEPLLALGLHVAAALHYLAREGLVHLDVKPDNVVMGAPPRLIDLSVARTLEHARRVRSPIGTDAYMAPEQCQPERSPGALGPPADVFGLAATLYHALAGRRPFPRAPGERFPQCHRAPDPLPRRTPRALAELLEAGLRREPAQRPTAAELAAGLEPLVAALPRRRR
jgi:eukaryotic-like serine/threonine-protein kinase